MSPMILAILGFVAIGAAGFALVPALMTSGRAEKRRKALQGDYQVHRANVAADRTRDNRRKTVQDALKAQSEALAKKKKKLTLQMKLFQAGMKIKRGAFIRNSVIFAAVIATVLFVAGVPLLFIPVFAAAAGYVLPMWVVSFKRKRYQAKYLDELPNAVETIVRGVKAGMPLNDSIRVVSKEIKEPVRAEFLRVLEQQSIGKSMMEAIQVLYDRVPLAEVNFLVVVITVQQQAGGNLSEALTNLAHVLRNRKKMKMKIKAMSSEAKASAMIIGALPLVVAILVSIAQPSYLVPLYSTSLGHMWIGIGIFMMAFGGWVMNRMIQFDY